MLYAVEILHRAAESLTAYSGNTNVTLRAMESLQLQQDESNSLIQGNMLYLSSQYLDFDEEALSGSKEAACSV